jgi:hypothetical protein
MLAYGYAIWAIGKNYANIRQERVRLHRKKIDMKKMPKVIKGDVRFNNECDYSKVEEIGGHLDCWGAGTKASFPKLTTIGGYLDCWGAGTKASFPKLTTIGGHLYCWGAGTKASFPKLTTIGGYLDCRGADTKASFPKLTTIGGHLYCEGADTKASFPKLKEKNCGNSKALTKIRLAFKRKGFFMFDNILSEIVSTRELKNGSKIHRTIIVGEIEVSFCIEIDGVFSHGATLKEAKESLLYKIGNRDKSAYEKWTLNKKITKKEAIESYRVITGACESGVRHFVESVGKLKSKYTVREIAEITKGQFGNECYANFFSEKN